MKSKKIISLLLAIVLLMSVSIAAAASYAGEARAVIGANLSDSDINTVYGYFGIARGDVEELTVTNDEEREYLEGVIAESKIGTRSISCIYIKLLDEGDGLNISVNNINWCTEEIYRNALITAGIYDAEVIIAAPFDVSGTAALTGLYKAYEDITGDNLDDNAKQTAVEELVITSEIADAIGSVDAAEVVNELKSMLDVTVDMTDEELYDEIVAIAERCGVTLSDDQIRQLITLVRNLEKLDTDELISKVEELKEFAASAVKTGNSILDFFNSVGNFFSKIGDFFGNLFS